MKRIMMCFILFITFLIFGCNSELESNASNENSSPEIWVDSESEKINVKFLYKGDMYSIDMLKGSKLSLDDLSFISNKQYAILLYGESFNVKYDNESLYEDVSFMVCDYDGTEKLGEMYTLKEAYDKKYISKNDIFNIYNNYTNPNKELILDKMIELKILNDRLVVLKKVNSEAMMENISIYGYYGNYNNSYVIRLNDVFSDYPAVIKELQIDDIVFQYSGPSFLVLVNK